MRERSHEIIEQDMQGMRKEIPKEGTYNCYGDAARKVAIGALEYRGTFTRVLKRMSLWTRCVEMEGWYTR